MAPSLRITDGTTTKTFVSGNFDGFTYFPRAPESADMTPGSAETVTETAEVLMEASAANIRADINAVERLFEDAKRRQETQGGPKVYVEYQAVTGDAWYRSEILDGRVQWDEEPAARRLSDTTPRVRVLLHWTRRYYWEGSLTQLELATSEDTTPTTDPVTLYNDDNATPEATNYIAIVSTQVTGALPAPIKLELIHAEATARDWYNFYLCNEYFSPNMAAFYRGSQATGGASGAWTGASTHDAARWTWDLNSTQLAVMAGRYWRALFTFGTAIAITCYWRLQVAAKVGALYVPIWVGDEVANAGGLIHDLGAAPIPPGGYDTATGGVALQVTARAAGSSGAVTCDFLQVTPAGTGQFRHIVQGSAFLIGQGDGLIDDGTEGLTYAWDDANSLHVPIFRAYGEPIYVWPGRTQRLRVLYDETTAKFVAGRALTARAWYRPRRLIV